MTIGTLLSLSACGTSTPSAVGSYKAMFDITGTTNHPTYPLFYYQAVPFALGADGHFVMDFGPGYVMKGTWSQSEGRVTLSGKVGNERATLGAVQQGRNLVEGDIVPKPVDGRAVLLLLERAHWRAVRD